MLNGSMKTLNEAVSELDGARNAARVKLEVLSIQARRALGDLEVKTQALQRKVTKRAEKVTAASANAALDVARSIRKFVEKQV